MDFQELRKFVLESVREFKTRDNYLRIVDSSERSMINKLSTYLANRILIFDIDTEYNRYGDEPKSLKGNSGFESVFPDLIIHKRGKFGANILVVEAKKNGNTGKDLEKIKAYLEEEHLLYEYGLLIDLQSGNKPILLTWINKTGIFLKEDV